MKKQALKREDAGISSEGLMFAPHLLRSAYPKVSIGRKADLRCGCGASVQLKNERTFGIKFSCRNSERLDRAQSDRCCDAPECPHFAGGSKTCKNLRRFCQKFTAHEFSIILILERSAPKRPFLAPRNRTKILCQKPRTLYLASIYRGETKL